MVTATSLPSLRLEYWLFQLTSVDFDRLRTVTHKKQKQVVQNRIRGVLFSNGEKRSRFSELVDSLSTALVFKLTYRRLIDH